MLFKYSKVNMCNCRNQYIKNIKKEVPTQSQKVLINKGLATLTSVYITTYTVQCKVVNGVEKERG